MEKGDPGIARQRAEVGIIGYREEPERTTAESSNQHFVVSWVASRYGLTPDLAVAVAGLAGLRGAA